MINCINVLPNDPRHIFVHSRDNCIREVNTNKNLNETANSTKNRYIF